MIIIVSGLYRSGSTVLFNYLKDIAKPTIYQPVLLHKQKDLKKFIKKILNVEGNILIKSHIINETAILELEKIDTVHILYPIRNLKDSIMSYYKFSCNDYNVLTETYVLFKSTLEVINSLHEKLHIVEYNNLTNNTDQTLKLLLEKCNIKFTDDQVTNTINKWSLKNVQDYISSLPISKEYDSTTLFYHNHISSNLDKDMPDKYFKIIIDLLISDIENIKQNKKIDLLNM